MRQLRLGVDLDLDLGLLRIWPRRWWGGLAEGFRDGLRERGVIVGEFAQDARAQRRRRGDVSEPGRYRCCRAQTRATGGALRRVLLNNRALLRGRPRSELPA